MNLNIKIQQKGEQIKKKAKIIFIHRRAQILRLPSKLITTHHTMIFLRINLIHLRKQILIFLYNIKQMTINNKIMIRPISKQM